LGWQSPEREGWRLAIITDLSAMSFVALDAAHKTYHAGCRAMENQRAENEDGTADNAIFIAASDIEMICENIAYWAKNAPPSEGPDALARDNILLREYSAYPVDNRDDLAVLLARRPDLARTDDWDALGFQGADTVAFDVNARAKTGWRTAYTGAISALSFREMLRLRSTLAVVTQILARDTGIHNEFSPKVANFLAALFTDINLIDGAIVKAAEATTVQFSDDDTERAEADSILLAEYAGDPELYADEIAAIAARHIAENKRQEALIAEDLAAPAEAA